MSKTILSLLSIISMGSAYATVYIGSENLYDNRGDFIGTAEHYADVYDRSGYYTFAHRSDSSESRHVEKSESSGTTTMMDRD